LKLLAYIRELFQSSADNATSHNLSPAQKHLACAALLIEVAVVDNEFDNLELSTLKTILNQQFNVPQHQLEELVVMAKEECTNATSLYSFTHLVNRQCDFAEKFDLVTCLWRIAYADGDLDKYEEYVIRKIADLIHLGHGEFIRAKHRARTEFA
jgi:uncharacterized tellurite resistance protein B-like protein